MNCSPYIMRRRRAIAEVMATQLEELIGPRPAVLFDDEPVTARCKNASCKFPLVTWSERASGECWPCARERAGNG